MENNQFTQEKTFEKLTNIINSVDQQWKNATDLINKHKEADVVLLVGTTGSGKSTLYNFLIGATFALEKVDKKPILKPSHDKKKVARMQEIIKQSTTKQIQCDFLEDQNLIIIDSPGFLDTNGDDFQIELVLQRLSQNSQIKFVYVQNNPLGVIQNNGTELVNFIKQFNLQEQNLEEIVIIFNQFINEDDEDDEDLNKNFKKELKKMPLFNTHCPKNIFITDYIKTAEILNQTFSKQRREDFLTFLKRSPKLQLKVNLKNTKEIEEYIEKQNKFIRTSCKKIIDHFKGMMNTNINQFKNIENLNNQILEEIQKNKKQTIQEAFDYFLKRTSEMCIQLQQDYKMLFNDESQQILDEFKRVFEFYLPFQSHIKSYENCNHIVDSIINDQKDFANEIKKEIKQKKEQEQRERERERAREREQKERERERAREREQKEREQKERQKKEQELNQQRLQQQERELQLQKEKEVQQQKEKEIQEKQRQENAKALEQKQEYERRLQELAELEKQREEASAKARKDQQEKQEKQRKDNITTGAIAGGTIGAMGCLVMKAVTVGVTAAASPVLIGSAIVGAAVGAAVGRVVS